MREILKKEKILNYLKDNNLTNVEFCKKCGIELSEFESLMNSQKECSVSTLFKVGLVLGIEVHDLLNSNKEEK